MSPASQLRRELGKVYSTCNTWGESFLDLVFPPVCQLCGLNRAGKPLGYVCSPCRKGVRFLEPPFCRKCGLPYPGAMENPTECSNCAQEVHFFEWARASVVISDVVLETIHRYKYSRHVYFEPFLGELFVSKSKHVLLPSEWDCILPVPLHPVRLREREFNQAERLGRYLSRATTIPLNTHSLRRVEPTRTQTTLTREERRVNVSRAFQVVDVQSVTGKRILVIDDVMTTGATTNACAKALKRSGASKLAVWTLARGLVGASAPALPVQNPPSTHNFR